MQICYLHQNRINNYTDNNGCIHQSEPVSLQRENKLLSVPNVAPNYYIPNFTSNFSNYNKKRFLLSEEEFDRINEGLKDLSQEETFDRLNIKYKKNEEGKYIISDFTSPFYEKIAWSCSLDPKVGGLEKWISQLNIDAQKLLENVVEIEGDADFSGLTLKPFTTLKRIRGNVSASLLDIKSLGSLETVDKGLYIDGSTLEDLGKLQECDLITVAHTRNLKSLSPLKKARTISIFDSNVENVSSIIKCSLFDGRHSKLSEKQKDYINSIATKDTLFT